jgi:RimJ/RimL family protein N-acetyltransferase
MADLEPYVAMEQDPDVRKYVGGYPRTREAAEQKFMNGVMQPVNHQLAMWATVLRTDNAYIGRCGVYPHFDTNGKAIEGEGALGLYIARQYWGKGYATEAGRVLTDHAFDKHHLKRIVTTIQVGNDASVKVIKKLGFELASTEEGVRSFYHFVLERA